MQLSDIKRNVLAPPRAVIYGVPGIGKTTLASRMPRPIFLPIEDGLGRLAVEALPRPRSYAEIVEAINLLLVEQHDYETFVLDSLDKIEPLIHEHVCATVPTEKGKRATRIEDYGYGKGYAHATTEWRSLLDGLDALRERGMMVAAIAHSTVVRFEAPDLDPYDRYQLRLDKRADALVCDWADLVLFCNYETTLVNGGRDERKRAIGSGKRVAYTTERPAWRAKNRYGLPDVVPLDWAVIQAAIQVEPVGPAELNQPNPATAT